MEQTHIKNQDTGERLPLAWSDGYGTFSTESQYEGRFFSDYGDGRLYEILDNGRSESVWMRDDA